ncbi:MAG: phenylacetate--CoA ligase [Gemmatimonadetes bacterium]|nr:phenylacetate--CoA ligase [Gemmatimonadota bacterium]MYG23387.1 phenylacetate--CoA ligase [Gemmatimonadota bacterium]MYJ37741.1 phenylacetate--CoA ligase [Gemmatimonadota bacterium]
MRVQSAAATPRRTGDSSVADRLDPEERLDPSALQRIQLSRLRGMLEPVLSDNVFYRNKLTHAGVHTPTDISSLNALRRLPFTTRQELLADQRRAPPYGTLPTYPLERYVQEHHTSGTSGQGLRWLDTRKSWEWLARCWVRIFRAAGVTRADRVFFPFSFGPFLGVWSGVEGARSLGCIVLPGGGKDSLGRVHAIMSDRPTVMVCTPTHALRLAEVAAEAGIDLAASALRVTIHAGEPGASLPATKARLTEALGAEVFDHAGATEVGAWGFECHARDGVHFNEAEFIFEIVDPVTGAPAREGELVVTNLGRTGMPAIRYRTGDFGRLHERPCACGSNYRRLKGGVRGRLDQSLSVRGVEFHPSEIENVIRGFREAGEFAVDVRRQETRDEIEVRVEVGSSDADGVTARLSRALRGALGIRFEVRAVPLGTLPRFPVKARRVTDHRESSDR